MTTTGNGSSASRVNEAYNPTAPSDVSQVYRLPCEPAKADPNGPSTASSG